MTVIPNEIHIASGVESLGRYPVPQLFAGDTPAVMTNDILLPAGTYLQYAPLGPTGAAWVAGQPIASITCYATSGGRRAAVYKAGGFNIDAIRWPANTTQAQIETASAVGNLQFRKLLWSDKRTGTGSELAPGVEAGGSIT